MQQAVSGSTLSAGDWADKRSPFDVQPPPTQKNSPPSESSCDHGWIASAEAKAMRVCGRFPNSPARATTVLGLEHFRATADGGVLALSFVTALLARPWKVGVPCQDHLRECSGRGVYRRLSI